MSTATPTMPGARGRGLPILLGVVGLVVVLGLWFVSAGNKLVALQENVNTAWA